MIDEFETEHRPRQIVEVEVVDEHVSLLIYTKTDGGGLAYLTRNEAVRLKQAIGRALTDMEGTKWTAR